MTKFSRRSEQFFSRDVSQIVKNVPHLDVKESFKKIYTSGTGR